MAKLEKTTGWKEYSNVIASVKNGSIARVYLVSGEEKFLIDNMIAFMKKTWIAPGAESLDFYMKDMGSSDLSVEDFQSLVGSPAFISKCRMTVIRNAGWWSPKASSNPKEVEKMKAAIAAVPDFATVVFLEDKVDKRKKQLIDVVSENGMLVEIDTQSEETLTTWIRSSLSRKNISINPDCVASIISRTDSSMRMIHNETTKIVLYCENQGISRIDMNLLNKLCVPDVRASVFNMTDAIGEKKPGRAIQILNDLILLKEPIPKIRLMLARHIRHLICAKELGTEAKVISSLKVHKFVAKNLVSQARGFTMEELEKIYFLCFESDRWVKTGKMEDRMSMEVLLAACGKVEKR